MKRLSGLFIVSVFLFSCNTDRVPEKDSTLQLSDSAFSQTPAAVSSEQNPFDNLQASPVQLNGQEVSTTPAGVTTAVAPTAPVGKGLNPPHGQPNHRCDIPVGAPLSSAPVQTGQTVQPSVATTPAVPKTITPAGMNPPHGEPGHRCDIAVGAPLSSAPATITPAAPQSVVVPNIPGGNISTPNPVEVVKPVAEKVEE